MGKIFGYVVVQPLSNREDIIDCYYITVIPTILGSGIRLFEKTDHEIIGWDRGYVFTKGKSGIKVLKLTRR